MIETNTYELKNDLMNYLEYYIDSDEEQQIESTMLDIIEKNENKTFKESCIMQDINNFEISKQTAALIIINLLYEYDEIDISNISENLIDIFNYQFSNALAILDLETFEIKYINLMQNESISDDVIVLYQIDANTDFTNMCNCDNCINSNEKHKIIDKDLYIECCKDDLEEYLYNDFDNIFNLKSFEKQIKKLY